MYKSIAFTFLADIEKLRVCKKLASKDYGYDNGHFLVDFGNDKGTFSIAFMDEELLDWLTNLADNGDKDCQALLAHLDQHSTGNLYKDLKIYPKYQ